MADTDQGALLTDAHRRKQLALATATDSQFRRAWRLLDPNDIDGSRLAWERQMVAIIAPRFHVSIAQAEKYLAAYRVAELGNPDGAVVIPRLNISTTFDEMDAYGPKMLKSRIGQGMDLAEALEITQRQVAARARSVILSGGRGLVRESAEHDRHAIGFRRKSDGDPCTFCAMLVSRGPAYTSEAVALAKGDGDPYHDHCGCTVEIIYKDWVPTEQEQQWVDSYYDAAEQATKEDGQRTAQTVLHRMRDEGNFRDSPARRAAAA